MEKIGQAYKMNLIALVEHHKKYCKEDCNVSLYLLRVMAEKVGVIFTNKEKELFI